ncbi:MAG TPA: isoprenylcysteine carboxylmethyltransferase family protein [Candidatus Acidoferrum sp.]|nr:isoprenylcysteine carboxylmethyltransferase family protein [Candidatus Acidoferrum sp.]
MSERKFWMRWRVRAGYIVAVAYWLLARPTYRSIIYGAAVAVVGLIIRGAASGNLRKDRELATSGPYAWTRNPLYFGSSFLAGGFIVAGHSWAAGLLIAVYFGVFYYAVMRNEESDLRIRFGSSYEEYRARVPLFIPRIAGLRAAGAAADGAAPTSFSWAQYQRNREYQALIGTVIGLGSVVLRMWVRSRWGY